MKHSDTTVVVFCRQPRPGVGKQRLAAEIGAQAAAQVAEGLWACVLEDLAVWPGRIVLAVADPNEEAWARTQASVLRRIVSVTNRQRGIEVCVQCPGNLGERLNNIDAALRASGHTRLLFIGSDSPGLAIGFLEDTAANLLKADVVLAPAEDGGVVAMANARPWPDLRDLPWSTPLLGRSLAVHCREVGLSVIESQGSFDVDDRASLVQAGRQLRADARDARRRLAALAGDIAAGSSP